jgi:hypothetical protein
VKRWILSAFLLLLPPLVQSEISYGQLAQFSLTPETLDGSFHQEKYLAALDATLISSGVFTYHRNKSIRWEILEPIHSLLTLTPTAVISKQGDEELVRLDASNNPVARIVGEIFFAVLTSDWEKLAPYFELSGTVEGQQWHAVLLPIDQTVAQAFGRIELKGQKLLEEIVLHEKAGDRTTIRLVNQR